MSVVSPSGQPSATTSRKRWPEGYDPHRTRRQLVDSALALFENNGFDRTSVQHIVSEAGLTKGAFYHHFESKEDLLWQIQNEYLDTQLEAAQEIVADGGTPAAQLRALIRLSLSGVAEYRAHVAIFHQERRNLTGERLSGIAEKRTHLENLIRGVVQRGIDEGVFRGDMDERIVTFGIIGMCGWTFQWFNTDGQLKISEVAEQFCEVVLDGLNA